MVASIPITPEQFLGWPDGKSYDLVGGRLVERHGCTLNSLVSSALIHRLARFADDDRRGWVFQCLAGYHCFPNDPLRVRRPPVSFVSRDRLEPSEIRDDWLTIPADLAVEIVAPDDLAQELENRVVDYLRAGFHRVWILYPGTRTASVHRHDGPSDHFTGDVELVGEGPLEGFRCKFADLLPGD